MVEERVVLLVEDIQFLLGDCLLKVIRPEVIRELTGLLLDDVRRNNY
jgi:hypothetical protein